MESNVTVSHGSINPHLQKWNARLLEREANEIKKAYGFDPEKVWKNAEDPFFSLKRAKRSIREGLKLRETNAAGATLSANAALVRYGVQRFMIGAYDLVECIYREIAEMVPSKTIEEWYAPYYRMDVPIKITGNEDYPQRQITGLEVRLRNNKFGSILALQRELVDDDQTGQIKRIAAQQGESMAYAEEKEAIVNFFNGTNYPIAGRVNKSSGNAISQNNLEAAWNALRLVTDPLGNYLLVKPDSLLVHSSDEITAKKLLQSAYQPSQPSATADTTGYYMTENVLKGAFTVYGTPFVNSSAVRARLGASGNPWAIFERGKGFVFQARTPVEVVQEPHNTGDSFQNDSIRYKVSRRFAVDWIDPSFTYFGN